MKLLGDAEVHYDKQSSAARAFGGRLVHNAFLHPYRARPNSNGSVDYFGHKFRAAEDIHNIDFFRNVLQAGIAFLAKDSKTRSD